MPTANWVVSAVFILRFCNNKETAGQYSQSCAYMLENAKRGSRQFSMFISENIRTMVDLF